MLAHFHAIGNGGGSFAMRASMRKYYNAFNRVGRSSLCLEQYI